MATTRQPREKTSSSSSSPSPSQTGRRAPRASVTGSPDRETPKLPERPTPNYLRPTVRSTATDASTRVGKPPPNAAAGSRLPARKPAEKSSSQPQRSPSSHNPRERATKSPSPSARSSVSPRPSLDKSSRTATGSVRAPPTRARSTAVAPTNTKRKVAGTATVNEHYATSDAYETEEKEIPISIDDHDPIDHVDLVDISPVDEQVLDELTDPSVLKDPEEISSSTPKPEQIEETEVPKDLELDHEKTVGEDPEAAEGEEKAVVIETPEVASVTGGEVLEEKAPAVEVATTEPVATKPAEAPPTGPKRAETQGRKKEAPRSNEVIEEFQSKLMEKRKNKVLALVGAFETVISLQEPAPAPAPAGQPQPSPKQSKGEAAPEDGGNAAKQSTET